MKENILKKTDVKYVRSKIDFSPIVGCYLFNLCLNLTSKYLGTTLISKGWFGNTIAQSYMLNY